MSIDSAPVVFSDLGKITARLRPGAWAELRSCEMESRGRST